LRIVEGKYRDRMEGGDDSDGGYVQLGFSASGLYLITGKDFLLEGDGYRVVCAVRSECGSAMRLCSLR
jgi:hypothetical protein